MYYYNDNWNRDRHTFTSLKAAKSAAKKEYGATIKIQKEGDGKFKLLVNATGSMPS